MPICWIFWRREPGSSPGPRMFPAVAGNMRGRNGTQGFSHRSGEPLMPGNSYPMRLLLSGFEGNMNIKYLRGATDVRPLIVASVEKLVTRDAARRG